jgi:hypothetical protein
MVLDFQVANCVTGASLHAILEPVNPLKGAIFEYVLVNGQVTCFFKYVYYGFSNKQKIFQFLNSKIRVILYCKCDF